MNCRFMCSPTPCPEPPTRSLHQKLLFLLFSVSLRKHKMSLKVPKIKDFYVSFRCSATIVSTCLEPTKKMLTGPSNSLTSILFNFKLCRLALFGRKASRLFLNAFFTPYIKLRYSRLPSTMAYIITNLSFSFIL